MIDGKTQFAGVIGWPVEHSLSPVIHQHWLACHGINAVYLPFPVHPDDLQTAIKALPVLGCIGVNLTIPHKEPILPFLDEVDVNARSIGAANTVVMRDGKLYGHNTDAYGFISSLKAGAGNYRNRSALVLGAGGAARAVVAALVQDGFTEITIMNRTREKAELLKKLGTQVRVTDWNAELPGADVVVNTTSLGMNGRPDLQVDLSLLPRHAVITDIVYSPLMTPLFKQAKARGFTIIDGLGMLLFQAQKAFSLWFGITPDVTKELREKILSRQEHAG